MLMSRRHKFIFIHIFKNAGTSIKKALSPYAATNFEKRANPILKKIGISCYDPNRYPAHIKAPELMNLMGKDRYRSFFTFAVVRNPWDWLVSLYTFMRKDRNHFQHDLAMNFKDFDDYISWRCSEDTPFQSDFVFSSDNIKVVDYIATYEQLDQEIDYICSKTGLPKITLPKLNVSKSIPYQEYYNKKTIELVRATYKRDIELFEYDFH